jgi:hypothetical protein
MVKRHIREIRDGEDNNIVIITVQFEKWEYAKLVRLAERRRSTVEDVLRGFAQSCQPDGGGWTHPASYRGPKHGP